MSDIAALIGQASAGKAPAVVLIEGDEYLARTSARELADAIVPSRERALNLIVLDAAAGAREILRSEERRVGKEGRDRGETDIIEAQRNPENQAPRQRAHTTRSQDSAQ